MSGIDGGEKFGSIYEKFKLGPGEEDQHLRDKGDGLYLHKGAMEALERRELKREGGAQHVWNVIEQEYGPRVSNDLLRHIGENVDHDPAQELFRSDLHQIKLGLEGKTPLKGQEARTENHERQMQVFCLDKTGKPGGIEDINEVRPVLDELLGCTLTDDQIRGLAGIPDRCSVRLSIANPNPRDHFDPDLEKTAVRISMWGGDDSDFSQITMTVYRGRGNEVHIYQDSIMSKVGKDRPGNLGACLLVRQLDIARSLGVSSIHNHSERYDRISGGFNGYYTWARYGGNAPLLPMDKVRYVSLLGEGPALELGKTNLFSVDEDNYKALLAALADPGEAFGSLRLYQEKHDFDFKLNEEQFVREIEELQGKDELDIQDLMQTQSGRALWRVFGFSIPLVFDLGNENTKRTFEQYTLPSSCFDLRESTV